MIIYIYAILLAEIQGRNEATRTNTAGNPRSQPATAPKLMIPT